MLAGILQSGLRPDTPNAPRQPGQGQEQLGACRLIQSRCLPVLDAPVSLS